MKAAEVTQPWYLYNVSVYASLAAAGRVSPLLSRSRWSSAVTNSMALHPIALSDGKNAPHNEKTHPRLAVPLLQEML